MEIRRQHADHGARRRVQNHAASHNRGVAVKPDDVARDICLSGFPAEMRPGVHVYLDPPAGMRGGPWKTAVEAVGK